MTDRYRPFANGSQAYDWEASNCDRCTKAATATDTTFRCPLQEALFEADVNDGSVSADVAARMGFIKHQGRYVWCCNEVDWTAAWRAEHAYLAAQALPV